MESVHILMPDMHNKMCGLYVVGLINGTPIIEWWMVMLVVKKKHQKDICYEESGLCALKYRHHSKFNSEHDWEGLCDHLKRENLH